MKKIILISICFLIFMSCKNEETPILEGVKLGVTFDDWRLCQDSLYNERATFCFSKGLDLESFAHLIHVSSTTQKLTDFFDLNQKDSVLALIVPSQEKFTNYVNGITVYFAKNLSKPIVMQGKQMFDDNFTPMDYDINSSVISQIENKINEVYGSPIYEDSLFNEMKLRVFENGKFKDYDLDNTKMFEGYSLWETKNYSIKFNKGVKTDSNNNNSMVYITFELNENEVKKIKEKSYEESIVFYDSIKDISILNLSEKQWAKRNWHMHLRNQFGEGNLDTISYKRAKNEAEMEELIKEFNNPCSRDNTIRHFHQIMDFNSPHERYKKDDIKVQQSGDCTLQIAVTTRGSGYGFKTFHVYEITYDTITEKYSLKELKSEFLG